MPRSREANRVRTKVVGETVAAEQRGERARPQPRSTEKAAALVVPVTEERLVVSKRQVETGGVRVRKIVHEHEEVIDQPLLRNNVVVERVPVNQYVAAAPPVRHEGDTLVVPLVEEVLVVEKRLVLREELRITKQQVRESRPQRVLVRREEAKIEPIPSAEAGADGTAIAKAPPSRRGTT